MFWLKAKGYYQREQRDFMENKVGNKKSETTNIVEAIKDVQNKANISIIILACVKVKSEKTNFKK